jgi:hypothetical protein
MVRRLQCGPGMKTATLFLSVFFLLPACVLDLEDGPELDSLLQELGSDTRLVYNFAGQRRYVRVNDSEVKLFMTAAAVEANNPRAGFRNSNHFKNSCGPTAAMNVFNWYGIVELEGQHCYWHSEFGTPPIWVCRDRITPSWLGLQMKTNNWTVGSVTMPGTRTSNFRSVFREYVERYMPADNAYQYRYEEGDGLHQYNLLWATLSQGHPIVVNYKTGTTKGHFAVIVGMEKAGNSSSIADDRVFLANGGVMSYGQFRELWRRDYYDFGTLSWFGERRYTRINLWNTTEPPPPPPGSGVSTGASGTIHLK